MAARPAWFSVFEIEHSKSLVCRMMVCCFFPQASEYIKSIPEDAAAVTGARMVHLGCLFWVADPFVFRDAIDQHCIHLLVRHSTNTIWSSHTASQNDFLVSVIRYCIVAKEPHQEPWSILQTKKFLVRCLLANSKTLTSEGLGLNIAKSVICN